MVYTAPSHVLCQPPRILEHRRKRKRRRNKRFKIQCSNRKTGRTPTVWLLPRFFVIILVGPLAITPRGTLNDEQTLCTMVRFELFPVDMEIDQGKELGIYRDERKGLGPVVPFNRVSTDVVVCSILLLGHRKPHSSYMTGLGLGTLCVDLPRFW